MELGVIRLSRIGDQRWRVHLYGSDLVWGFSLGAVLPKLELAGEVIWTLGQVDGGSDYSLLPAEAIQFSKKWKKDLNKRYSVRQSFLLPKEADVLDRF